jgi:RNA polymerase sigma factor (sigma-70 family)
MVVGDRGTEDRWIRLWVDTHGAAVRALVCRYEYDPRDVDELVADVFCVAYRNIEKLKLATDDALRCWLLSTARHVVQNHVRRAMSRRRLTERLARMPLPDANAADVDYADREAELRAQRRDAAVRHILDGMRDDERLVLVMDALGGTGPAIGHALGVSPNAARKRLMRARVAFRAAFDQRLWSADAATSLPLMTTPVVLVHGWGGSFDATWSRPGFAALLEDAGRSVIGVDLLGHGQAPKPHDPAAYSDLTARVIEAMPDEPVDAVGFSLGAITMLHLAVAHPHRIRRLVLAGIGNRVIGDPPLENPQQRIIDALESTEPVADATGRQFVQYASQPGNDKVALTAVLKRPRREPLPPDALAVVTCPTLVVVGERDTSAPSDLLAAAFPDGRLRVIPNVDHAALPESFGFIDAALEFLGAAS